MARFLRIIGVGLILMSRTAPLCYVLGAGLLMLAQAIERRAGAAMIRVTQPKLATARASTDAPSWPS
jgi:hypothetical protein